MGSVVSDKFSLAALSESFQEATGGIHEKPIVSSSINICQMKVNVCRTDVQKPNARIVKKWIKVSMISLSVSPTHSTIMNI